jgi:hypothetical protein
MKAQVLKITEKQLRSIAEELEAGMRVFQVF